MRTFHTDALVIVASTQILTMSLPSHATEDMSKMDIKTSATSEGEVRKIDKDAGKSTPKHGPVTNLQMPGMTMTFRVADPALLNRVKKGDKVKFHAEKRNGAITVTEIQGEG